ncbi:MAG TPA: glycosyltransferase [Gallionellaceae bacterium]|nr:glycosyltransferase [Gallionellaceae bacterium]
MEYLLVLNVPFYRVSANEFACESAFAGHLRVLLHRIPVQYDAIRVCGPSMPAEDYQRDKGHLGHIQEQQERIFLTELYPNNTRYVEFLKSSALNTFRKLWQAVSRAGLVHSGPSMNLFQPIGIFSLIAAKLLGKKSIAVVDIDIRKDVERAYQLGMINKIRYLIERFIFEPLRRLQLGWVARNCSLVLFKSKSLVSDYGNKKDSVKNFFDTSHSSQHIISEARLAEKVNRKHTKDQPIRCVYFGRLVARKGIDYCVRSVVQARKNHNTNISLTIIGDGPDKEKLASLIKEQEAERFIFLQPPIQFGPELFDTLYRFDILLAAPLTEDTPRSAFDGMAAGMALCAYDTDYYLTLAQFGPMVKVSPWLNVEAMAETIACFAKDPVALRNAQIDARKFAEENTQEIWLEKRLKWTEKFCSPV